LFILTLVAREEDTEEPDAKILALPEQPNVITELYTKCLSEAKYLHEKAQILNDFGKRCTTHFIIHDDDYSELSFDVIIHIFEFLEFSLDLTLSRMLTSGPITKTTLNHYSVITKLVFGYQIGDPQRDTQLLFPTINICHEDSSIYQQNGKDMTEGYRFWIDLIPSGVRSLTLYLEPDPGESFDLTRLKQLHTLICDFYDPTTYLFPPSITNYRVGNCTTTPKIQFTPNIISLGTSSAKQDEIPFDKLPNLKKFCLYIDKQEPTMYRQLLTSSLVHLDLSGTKIKMYPGFVMSQTITTLIVFSIGVEGKYKTESFKIQNQIQKLTVARKLSISIWIVMFQDSTSLRYVVERFLTIDTQS
jgi:hypothetical protein